MFIVSTPFCAAITVNLPFPKAVFIVSRRLGSLFVSFHVLQTVFYLFIKKQDKIEVINIFYVYFSMSYLGLSSKVIGWRYLAALSVTDKE